MKALHPSRAPLGYERAEGGLRWHNVYRNGRRGQILRDGGIAEAPHGVTGLMQVHCDRGERWPIPAAIRSPNHEDPLGESHQNLSLTASLWRLAAVSSQTRNI